MVNFNQYRFQLGQARFKPPIKASGVRVDDTSTHADALIGKQCSAQAGRHSLSVMEECVVGWRQMNVEQPTLRKLLQHRPHHAFDHGPVSALLSQNAQQGRIANFDCSAFNFCLPALA